jgi:hypothetical protein
VHKSTTQAWPSAQDPFCTAGFCALDRMAHDRQNGDAAKHIGARGGK